MFAKDSTVTLIKKYCTYRLMATNFFIDNSMRFMRLGYKTIGQKNTNRIIGSTVGCLFTAGQDVQSLREDILAHKNQNILTLATYAMEGALE